MTLTQELPLSHFLIRALMGGPRSGRGYWGRGYRVFIPYAFYLYKWHNFL